jgi:thymidine kinase
MFSGKTTELLKRVRMAKLIFDDILIVNHNSDVRYYDNVICSHDKDKIRCVNVETLCSLFDMEMYRKAAIVFVDEAQFFPDLATFAVTVVEKHHKSITVCSLNSDSDRKEFGQVLDLIPLCDSLVKLNALCLTCRDGTEAIFSKRVTINNNPHDRQNNTQILVGADDVYIPVCRKHYLAQNDAY